MMTLKDKISLINEIFDKREAEQIKFLKESREKEIAKTIVNDTIEKLPFMSIGNMVSIFESISPDIIKTKNGKKIINDFTAIVKEDVNIKNSYLLRENVFSGNCSLMRSMTNSCWSSLRSSLVEYDCPIPTIVKEKATIPNITLKLIIMLNVQYPSPI